MGVDRWDMWVDFARIYDGFTYGDVEDLTSGQEIQVGQFIVVGDEDADPAVAEVIDIRDDGVVLLRVLPGPANEHHALIGPRSA
jgi:hypothetical protein